MQLFLKKKKKVNQDFLLSKSGGVITLTAGPYYIKALEYLRKEQKGNSTESFFTMQDGLRTE